MATVNVNEVLPAILDSTSEPPSLFDGTTRLYTNYQCPFAQRVWIARNYKGLQDKIKLVPIDLQNRPAWYKEKIYPENKVPALEHNGKVIGESLDLLKYLESNFEGPALLPDDAEKLEFAEELLSYTNTAIRSAFSSFKEGPNDELGSVFDHLENALQKFDDGPFFLGKSISLVDIAYIPFIERFHIFYLEVFNHDISTGRPKLTAWFEEMNKLEAYKPTKCDPEKFVTRFRAH